MRSMIINMLAPLAYFGILVSGVLGGVLGFETAKLITLSALRVNFVLGVSLADIIGMVLGVVAGSVTGVLVFGSVLLMLEIRDWLRNLTVLAGDLPPAGRT